MYDLPDESTRLLDKEIKGQDEYEEELKSEPQEEDVLFEETPSNVTGNGGQGK